MEQGMMSAGQPQQQGGYNGEVSVMGNPVMVTGGLAEFNGGKYYVSDNGEVVIDQKRMPIGYVENGEFKKMDKQQADKLRQMGLFGEKK